MHTFQVWAPNAQRVEVIISDQRIPMEKGDEGWWRAAVEQAGPGTDYQFSIDGSPGMPDPRSAYQPQGIDGPSRVVDHSAFRWTDRFWQARPLSSAVLYELHIGTFTPEGTFRSAIEKLDYLLDLGVTHIEFMPVNEFSGSWGWGYDGVDLYAPHHAYGTPDDLKALVNACHEKGLGVFLDVVYNHFGPIGNYLEKFGPYFTDAYNTPWGPAVNLDHEGSIETRRFFADNALMWLEDYHFDGLRLDAIHAFYDRSAIHFLEFLSKEVEQLSAHLGRHFTLIAESDLNDPRVVTSREADGYGMDAQWSDDFHHALHSVLTGEQKGYYEEFGALGQLGKALEGVFVFDGIHSPHRNRVHGRPVIGLSGHHFLGYSQNHDQVGNRAQGERLSQLINIDRQKIAAAVVLTAPFVPMLFQGEEFAASTPFQYFTHHDDVELGKKVSEGRRNEFKAFGWKPEDVPDPQDPQTFERSKLKWSEVGTPPHSEMLAWYRQLIALRKDRMDLTSGLLEDVEVKCDEGALWMSVNRGNTTLVCNFNTTPQQVPVEEAGTIVLASKPGCELNGQAVEMPPESVAIVGFEQAGASPEFRSDTLNAQAAA